MSFGEPCEGGCGCRLDVDGGRLREVTDEPQLPGPGPCEEHALGEVHTPRRCRTIRRFRETATEAIPDGEVVVAQPWGRVDALDVRVRRGDVQAQARVAVLPMLYARTYDLVDAMAVETARRLAHVLDKPQGHGPVSSSPVIARDPRR